MKESTKRRVMWIGGIAVAYICLVQIINPRGWANALADYENSRDRYLVDWNTYRNHPSMDNFDDLVCSLSLVLLDEGKVIVGLFGFGPEKSRVARNREALEKWRVPKDTSGVPPWIESRIVTVPNEEWEARENDRSRNDDSR